MQHSSSDIRRTLIRLAAPLLLGSMLQQLYGAVDALLIGRILGSNAFAAIGVAGTVMNLFLFVVEGFCTGLSVLVGQLYGRRDWRALRRESFVCVVWGGLLTLALSACALALLRPLLRITHTPARLIPETESYLRVILTGMLAAYGYNLFAGMLRAVGNTRAALALLAASTLLNMLLDLLLLCMTPLGVAGAAFATTASQALCALGCYLYIRRRYAFLLFSGADAGLHPALLRRSLSCGIACAMHESNLYIGKLLVQGTVNSLGTASIAAYAAALRAEGFVNAFGSGGAQAMSVFIAQRCGARDTFGVRRGLVQGLLLLILCGVILSGGLYAGAQGAMSCFLQGGDDAALAQGVSYLRTISAFYLFNFIGCAFVGYFRGIGRMMVPVLGTTLHISIRVVLSALGAGRLGLSAVAVASGIGWMAVVLYQLLTLFIPRRRD